MRATLQARASALAHRALTRERRHDQASPRAGVDNHFGLNSSLLPQGSIAALVVSVPQMIIKARGSMNAATDGPGL